MTKTATDLLVSGSLPTAAASPSAGPVATSRFTLGRRGTTLLTLFFLLALATALRILAAQRGLWLDETISVFHADRSVSEVIDRQLNGYHPPLYHLQLHLVIEYLGSTPLALRSLSILWSLVTVLAVWCWSREAFPQRSPLPAAALAAVSPFALWYGSEVRMYAPLLALTALSGWLAWRLLLERDHARLTVAALTMSLAALIYTHYFGALFFVALGAVAAVRLVDPAGRRRAASVMGSLAVASLLFAPWVVAVLTTRDAAAAGDPPTYPAPGLFSVMGAGWEMVVGFHSPAFMAVLVALWPACCLVLFALLPRLHAVRWHHSGLALLITLPPLLLIIVSTIGEDPVFDPRYLTVCAAPLYVLLGGMFTRIRGRVALPLGLVVLSAGVGAGIWQNADHGNPRLFEIDKALERAYAEGRPGDLLVIAPPFQREPLLHYFEPPRTLEVSDAVTPQAAWQEARRARPARVFLVTAFEDAALASERQGPTAFVQRFASTSRLVDKRSLAQAVLRTYAPRPEHLRRGGLLSGFRVDLEVTSAGRTTNRFNIARLTPIPSAAAPAVTVLGVRADGRTLVLVRTGSVAVRAPGRCLRTTGAGCTVFEAKRGDVLRTARGDVSVRVARVAAAAAETQDPATAETSRLRESPSGRKALRAAIRRDRDLLMGLEYLQDTGALVDRGLLR